MHDCQKFREEWIAGCSAGEDPGCDECRLFCEDTSMILMALRSPSNPVPDASAPYWTWSGTRLRARLVEERTAAGLRAARYRWIAAYAAAASVAVVLTLGTLRLPSPAVETEAALPKVVLETNHIEGLDRGVVNFLQQSELLVRDFTKIDPSYKEDIAEARQRATRSLAILPEQKRAAADFEPVRITLDQYENVLRDIKNLDSPDEITDIQMRIRRNGLIANLKAYQPRVVPVSQR
jgi:hypothetical protein